MPEEYRENLKSEEGIRQLAEENPFEFQIMDTIAAQLQSVSDSFIIVGRLTRMEKFLCKEYFPID